MCDRRPACWKELGRDARITLNHPMEADAASLENLRDIAVPPAVSWWPLAPGWWVVFVLIIPATLFFSYRTWRTWRANAYRRAALNELDGVNDLKTVVEILKRAALVAYPRVEIASLTGSRWCAWLEKTGSEPMSDGVRVAFIKGVFARAPEGESGMEDVTAFVSAWIAKHRPDPISKGGDSC